MSSVGFTGCNTRYTAGIKNPEPEAQATIRDFSNPTRDYGVKLFASQKGEYREKTSKVKLTKFQLMGADPV